MESKILFKTKCYILQKLSVTTRVYIASHRVFQRNIIYIPMENQKLLSPILKSSISGFSVTVQSRLSD